jgi:5-(aminomethyl)-3-furanmethanol phosphate kinase
MLTATPVAAARALREERVVLWWPRRWLRSAPDELTHWGATSDSLAATLAASLDANRLVLVKSCPIEPGLDLATQSARGVIDADFCRITAPARYSIDLLSKTESSRLRRLLQADAAPPSMA